MPKCDKCFYRLFHKTHKCKEKKHMALTTMERQVARQILKYYRGELPGLPMNETLINAFLDADEAGKRSMIKTYLSNIVLPQMQTNLIQLTNASTDVQNKINDIKAYTTTVTP